MRDPDFSKLVLNKTHVGHFLLTPHILELASRFLCGKRSTGEETLQREWTCDAGRHKEVTHLMPARRASDPKMLQHILCWDCCQNAVSDVQRKSTDVMTTLLYPYSFLNFNYY